MIALDLDMKKFNAESFYLIGSVLNQSASHTSDIDFILLVNDNSVNKEVIAAWFEGWNCSLRERMYKRTGYKIERFIDVKIFTNEELAEDKYFSEVLSTNGKFKILKKA